MSEIASLSVRIDADVKEALQSLDTLSNKLESAGKGMTSAGKSMTTWVTGPIVAAVGGLTALAISTTDSMDRIGDLTQITGMSTAALQEWAYVGKVAGAGIETVSGAVEGLVKRLPTLQMEAAKQDVQFNELVKSGVSVADAMAQVETGGGKASRGLLKLGLSFNDLSAMKPDDMINTLMVKLADLSDPLERNAIGSSLFGGEWKDIALILGKGSEGIVQLKNDANSLGLVMSEDTIAQSGAFQDSLNSLQMQLSGVGNELTATLLPILQEDLIPFIETSVLPAIQSFAGFIGDIVNWFTNLSPAAQGTIAVLVGLVAIVGPILMGIGQFILMLSALAKVTAIQTTVTWLLNAAFLANPITWVIAGIIALIAIVWLLATNWDAVVKWLTGLWEWMKTAVGNMIASVGRILGEFGAFLGNIFKKAIDGIIYAITHFNIFALINDYIIKPIFGVDLFDIGKNMIDGLIKGAGSMLKNLGKFFLDLIPDWIKGPFKLALGIKSPSKVFMGFGEYIAEGLANGIESGEGIIKNASTSMSDATVSGFNMPDNSSGTTVQVDQKTPIIRNEVLVQFGDKIYRTIADGINEAQRYDGRQLIEVL